MNDVLNGRGNQLMLFPDKREDWLAIRVSKQSFRLIDVVEQCHLAMLEDDEFSDYASYLSAYRHDMARTGHMFADDVVAAGLIVSYADKHEVVLRDKDGNAVSRWQVMKAMRAVLSRRYHRSRKHMRVMAEAIEVAASPVTEPFEAAVSRVIQRVERSNTWED